MVRTRPFNPRSLVPVSIRLLVSPEPLSNNLRSGGAGWVELVVDLGKGVDPVDEECLWARTEGRGTTYSKVIRSSTDSRTGRDS